MKTSHRFLITIATVLVTSFVASLLWRYLFDTRIPGYLSGLIGGLAAVPVWEMLRKRS